MSESIHDLFRKVREHPDYVFGTVFVRDDFKIQGDPSALKHVEEAIVLAGFESAESAGYFTEYPFEEE